MIDNRSVGCNCLSIMILQPIPNAENEASLMPVAGKEWRSEWGTGQPRGEQTPGQMISGQRPSLHGRHIKILLCLFTFYL